MLSSEIYFMHNVNDFITVCYRDVLFVNALLRVLI